MSSWPKITASTTTPVSQWMKIISRHVQFSEKTSPERYDAIEQPDYVVALALTPQDRIILVRQYRPAVERFSLEFPAGMVDSNEDPGDAVARELLEETGYPTKSITLIGRCATCAGRISNSMFSFFIRTEKQIPNFVEEPGVGVCLVTPLQLREMILSGEFSEQAHLGVVGLAVASALLTF